MDEQNEKNVRRFGRREQKESLERPASLFPKDEPTKAIDFDINSLALPDTDAEALEVLSSLRDEVKAPKITPSEERYPPLRPSPAPKPLIATQTVSKVQAPPQKSNKNGLYNAITLLLILGMLAFIAWVIQVWINPQSPLNPFAPPTPYVLVTATPNNGFIDLPATPNEQGEIFIVITDMPAPTIAIESAYPFIVPEIIYAPNSNAFACNWWSIAGTVRDNLGGALDGYRVRVRGEGVNETVFSGASQAFGAGGYELPLVGTPRVETFTVQLFSPQDAPLSDAIQVQTRAECEANVSIVNFIENR